MKRTGEFILSIIALIINGLSLLGGLSFKKLSTNTLEDQLQTSGTELSKQDIHDMVAAMNHLGSYLIILASISIILAIIALVCLQGNKKPKLAGLFLIIAAVSSIITVVPFILYLIAGILALIKRPKGNRY
ncbi:putative Tic20 family protein [Pullulanibacillus pueri]|uniref:DUF4064 domain-containing protein n=1 Tax=Pullulanibacillus pueri TaxID=1437324 RepID=A0A8J2ZUD5_9BACL|nr:DUF4064 domain-containing protein [Pullulanibacillus pueri]MBM7681045.1 putative Tic20 family protein [Pullulanibacillus pueri]GGH76829.1 hypothetical protein GCM10007096_07820 [Pullulanibacillus pueri]